VHVTQFPDDVQVPSPSILQVIGPPGQGTDAEQAAKTVVVNNITTEKAALRAD